MCLGGECISKTCVKRLLHVNRKLIIMVKQTNHNEISALGIHWWLIAHLEIEKPSCFSITMFSYSHHKGFNLIKINYKMLLLESDES